MTSPTTITQPTGTQDGALAWWATIAPNHQVPQVWVQGGPPNVVASSDGTYQFTGSANLATGGGYGNIAWIDSSGKSQTLYVSWDNTGKTSGDKGAGSQDPTPPDQGQVIPQSPLDLIPGLSWTSGLGSLLSALLDKDLWVRIGEGALAIGILIIGLIILLKREGVLDDVARFA